MPFELKHRNVVVIAKTFNLSIINHVWLFKNGIFSEEELSGCPSIPVLVEARSDDFIFQLTPERLQFSVSPDTDNSDELIKNKIGKIISELPQTPYTAAGINLIYLFDQDKTSYNTLTRFLFCPEDSALYDHFNTPDARFGGYFSKEVLGTRLRLEVRPVVTETNVEKLRFSYNFHSDLKKAEKPKGVLTHLEKWTEAQHLAQEINKNVELKIIGEHSNNARPK